MSAEIKSIVKESDTPPLGYPGIPPGAPDRPQAAVKGVRVQQYDHTKCISFLVVQAIEVRVGLQGVKAKWVRIELRKVETLPGGGQANTFYDFVGPSPVNLWNSSDEYGVLKSVSLRCGDGGGDFAGKVSSCGVCSMTSRSLFAYQSRYHPA